MTVSTTRRTAAYRVDAGSGSLIVDHGGGQDLDTIWGPHTMQQGIHGPCDPPGSDESVEIATGGQPVVGRIDQGQQSSGTRTYRQVVQQQSSKLLDVYTKSCLRPRR